MTNFDGGSAGAGGVSDGGASCARSGAATRHEATTIERQRARVISSPKAGARKAVIIPARRGTVKPTRGGAWHRGPALLNFMGMTSLIAGLLVGAMLLAAALAVRDARRSRRALAAAREEA